MNYFWLPAFTSTFSKWRKRIWNASNMTELLTVSNALFMLSFLVYASFYLQLMSFIFHTSNESKNSRAYQNLLAHLYPLNYRINVLTNRSLIYLQGEIYVTCISRCRKMRHNLAQCAINVYTVMNIKCHFWIYVNIEEAYYEFCGYSKSIT